MEFTRQRRKKSRVNEKYIVHSHVGMAHKLISILVSMIMWAYMLIIIEVFISAILDYNNEYLRLLKSSLKITNDSIQEMVVNTAIVFGVSLVTLLLWKIYNKKRYGKLNRRKMPEPTSDNEILALDLINPELYYKLKMQKVIILPKSPIKELHEEKNEKAI